MTIRFDGKTAIITGAGRGLGRSHALALANLGANVVVNDLGADVDGTGGSSDAANEVVAEIKAAGGNAIANGSSVTDQAGVDNLVKQSLDAFGQIDILINNAGILRDRTFHKVSWEDFYAVLDVHLLGTIRVTHAVWPLMREQKYGRVIVTSSQNGTYGNFGQSAYATAKMGVIGFMNALRIEGGRNNLHINTLVPVATSRMTEGTIIATEEDAKILTPEAVAQGALFLVSEDAPNGAILNAGGGSYSRSYVPETKGVYLGDSELTPDAVAANWDAISEDSHLEVLEDGPAQFTKFLEMARGTRK